MLQFGSSWNGQCGGRQLTTCLNDDFLGKIAGMPSRMVIEELISYEELGDSNA